MLLTIDTDPVKLPAAEGVNVTGTKTAPPLAIEIGKLTRPRANPVPLTFAAEIERAEVPVFETFKFWLNVLVTKTLPKPSVAGAASCADCCTVETSTVALADLVVSAALVAIT